MEGDQNTGTEKPKSAMSSMEWIRLKKRVLNPRNITSIEYHGSFSYVSVFMNDQKSLTIKDPEDIEVIKQYFDIR